MTLSSRFRRVLAGAVFAIGLATASAQAEGLLDMKKDDIVIGNPAAPITIVEYASLNCSHCAHFYMTILPELYKKYIEPGKVKLIARDFPLSEPALKAAMLVHCSPKDKQQAFLRVLYGSQEKWAFDANYKDLLGTMAKLGGMSQQKFDACLKDTTLEKRILEERKAAEDILKIEATPTLFIGDQKVVGPKDVMDVVKVLEPMLAKPAK